MSTTQSNDKTDIPNNNKLETYFFIAVFLFTGWLVYLVARPYLSLIMLALIFSIAVYPLYRFLYNKLGHHTQIATSLTLFISFLVIFIPTALLTKSLVNEALHFKTYITTQIDNESTLFEQTASLANEIIQRTPLATYGYSVDAQQLQTETLSLVKPVTNAIVDEGIALGTKSASFFTSSVLFIIFVAAILPSVRNIKKYLFRLSPFSDEIDERYATRIVAMTRAMLKGTILIAIVQGAYSGLVLWLFGVPYALLLAVIMMFLAIIPIVGTVFVNVPVGIILLLTGNPVAGIVIILNQILIVGNIDNIMRPMLVPKESELPPALLLLAILGGLQVFGMMAFVYGPVIMISFLTTLEIYEEKYQNSRKYDKDERNTTENTR